jgi:transcriptional regulator with XRE-family HTH domain
VDTTSLLNTYGVSAEIIAGALGEELRRAREKGRWSRAEFVKRLPSGIGDRTLLAYEHGLRHLTIIRLIELCEALGVVPTDVMTLAFERARLQLENLVLQVDLRAMIANKSMKFRPMHQWACNRLNDTPTGIAELTPTALRELAAMIGYPRKDLADYLARFTPETAFDAAAAPSRTSADGKR